MIYTIGHSTRKEKDFLELLHHYSIHTLVDIRTIPRSRWNPQFNRTTLEKSLSQAGISYIHVPGLGGLREPSPKSSNIGLKNAGLRGYADHMQTTEFEEALARVIALGRNQTVALVRGGRVHEMPSPVDIGWVNCARSESSAHLER